MGRRSGGRKTIIPVIGHPHKFTTSEKWARQAQRQGKGQIVDHIFYWATGDVFFTHHERSELQVIEDAEFEFHGAACDIAHEQRNDADPQLAGGPQLRTIQFERVLKARKATA